MNLKHQTGPKPKTVQARISLFNAIDNLNEVMGFKAFWLDKSPSANVRPYTIFCLDTDFNVIGKTTNLTRGQVEAILSMVDHILTRVSKGTSRYKLFVETFGEET